MARNAPTHLLELEGRMACRGLVVLDGGKTSTAEARLWVTGRAERVTCEICKVAMRRRAA